MYYLSGILWLSSNMCETDKKGLTELSEINLVRPFFVGFYFPRSLNLHGAGASNVTDNSISPIHFTYLNYILQIRKQSQEVAIVIDGVVIL